MAPRTTRRHVLKFGVAASIAVPLAGWCQPVPAAIRVLCGYPAGGAVDVVSRRIADRLGSAQSRAAIVENRPGAAGRLVVEALKAATPEGSTLLVTPASVLTMYPHIYRNIGYDSFSDVSPVCAVASTDFCLAVGPQVNASVQSLEDFSRWCQALPDQATCGNAGAGSFPHFMALLAADELGFQFRHVPYRGGSAAMQALAGEQVSCALGTEGSALPLVQGGRIRVIATTGAMRSRFYPDANTFKELGHPRLQQAEWFGVFLPRAAPSSVVQRISYELRSLVGEVETAAAWERSGLNIEHIGPSQLQTRMRSEYDFWAPIIKQSGFTPEV